MIYTRNIAASAGSRSQAAEGKLRRLLFQTSALGLGVSAAILNAGVAEAQAPTCQTAPGTVNCLEGAYGPLGFNPTQNTTITIAPGSTVGGLSVFNAPVGGVFTTTDLTLNAADVDFTRPGAVPGQPVVIVNAFAGNPPGGPGNVTIVASDVEATAFASAGIVGVGRNVSITAESSHTRGLQSPTNTTPFAVLAQSNVNGGSLSIDVGETSTVGNNAHAILAFAINTSANIDINSGTASTSGTNAFGLFAETASGEVNMASGVVNTTGQGAIGILGRSLTGPVNIDSGSVTTTGRGAYGVLSSGGGDQVINSTYVNVSGDVIMATGQRAIGIVGSAAFNPNVREGNVVINSDLVEYSGAGAIGIYAATFDGDITINTGDIVADASSYFSDPAIGGNGLTYSPVSIATDSYTGNVTINSGSIINLSENGAGIATNRTTGTTTINTQLIETHGAGAMGITTGGVHGDVIINSNVITTHGDAVAVENLAGAYLGRDLFYADAIEAISLSGHVTVNSNDATVLGEGNQALTLIASQGATLNSRNATNVGEGMNAIGVATDNGLIDVNLTGDTSSVNGTGVSIVGLDNSNVEVDIAENASIIARDGGLLIVTGPGSTVITNHGHIETTGTELATATGAAIDVKASVGSSVVINNHGTISGGLAGSNVVGAAISYSDGDVNETLNLFTGSQIIGSVDGQGGTDTLNLVGTVDAITTSQGFGDILNFETLNANSGYWVQTGQTDVDTINVNGGALILTGSAAGATTIAEGAILQIGAGGTTGSLSGDLTANGTLIFNRSDDYLFGGALAGSGSLIKRGEGLVTIDGLYSFTGTTAVQAGRLKITQLAADGDLDLGDGGELDLSGGEQAVGGLNGEEGSSVNIDDGSLTINQDEGEVSTFGGAIVGDGALTVDGGGELNLTGVNTYSGPTTVENGILRVNGSISSAVTVNDGSVLGGAGTINGSILIRRNAVIAPGNSPGVLTVAGPLTLAAGSTYNVEVDPSHPLLNDRIDASGLVTIQSGALLEVAPQGPINLYQRVNEYTIINAAGGLVGTFNAGDVSSTMALLNPRLLYSPTAVRLQLIRNDVRFNTVANSPNQFAVATAAEATGSTRPVYNALIAQSNAGLRAGYDALSGEVHGSVASYLVHEADGQRDAILRRASRADGSGVWVEGLSQETSFDDNSGRGSAKAETSTANVSAGGQLAFERMSVGASVSYARTDLDVELRGSDMTIASVRGNVFASAQAGFVIGRLGAEYAQADMEGSRSIVFPGVSEAALSEYSATQMQVFGEVAFDSDLGLFDMEPFVSFAAMDTDIDAFQESGPLGLTVNESSRYITVASAGVRVSGPDDWLLKPRLDVTYRHAEGDRDGVVTSAFAGGPRFDVLGANVDPDSVVLAAGFDYAIAPGIDMSVSYSGAFGASTQQEVIGARFGMRF